MLKGLLFFRKLTRCRYLTFRHDSCINLLIEHSAKKLIFQNVKLNVEGHGTWTVQLVEPKWCKLHYKYSQRKEKKKKATPIKSYLHLIKQTLTKIYKTFKILKA